MLKHSPRPASAGDEFPPQTPQEPRGCFFDPPGDPPPALGGSCRPHGRGIWGKLGLCGAGSFQVPPNVCGC